MKTSSVRAGALTTARRALIVQRVIVDGWSSAKVAATFGLSQRLIDIWVADYRRHGMASLRRPARESLAGEIVQLTVSQPVRGLASRIASGLRRFFGRDHFSETLSLRRSNDELGGR
jgi:transposase-like protein